MQLKAIETNKGVESHIAGLYTQGSRMIFLIVIELKSKRLPQRLINPPPPPPHVTLEIEWNAFYFFSSHFL